MVKDGITTPQIGIWEIIKTKKNRRKVMPMGKGTYGSKKGKAAAKKAMKKRKRKNNEKRLS